MAQGENQDPYKSQVSSMNTGRSAATPAWATPKVPLKYNTATSAARAGNYGRKWGPIDTSYVQGFARDTASALGRLFQGSLTGSIKDQQGLVGNYTVPNTYVPMQGYSLDAPERMTLRRMGQTPTATSGSSGAYGPPPDRLERTLGLGTDTTGGGGGGGRPASNLSATAGSVLPALDPQTAFALRQLAIQANRDYALSQLDAQNAEVNAYLSSSEAARTGRRGVTGRYLDDLDVMAETGGVDMTSPATGGIMTQDYLNNLAQLAIRENMDQAQAEQDRAMADLSNFEALHNAILNIRSAETAARMQAGVSETGSAKPMPVAKKTKKKKVK